MREFPYANMLSGKQTFYIYILYSPLPSPLTTTREKNLVTWGDDFTRQPGRNKLCKPWVTRLSLILPEGWRFQLIGCLTHTPPYLGSDPCRTYPNCSVTPLLHCRPRQLSSILSLYAIPGLSAESAVSLGLTFATDSVIWGSSHGVYHLLMYTVRKFNWRRYCLGLCD